MTLELRRVEKSFGGVRALRGVDFDVSPGEIVGLLGGNGAGKSTLMKIAAGVHLPDTGTVSIDGQSPQSPADAIRLGVSLVRQELIQAEDLDVGANVLLGHEPARFGVIDRKELYRRAARLLNSASLRSSAGKKHSMRTSCRVTSCGVPSVAMVVKTDSDRPLTM